MTLLYSLLRGNKPPIEANHLSRNTSVNTGVQGTVERHRAASTVGNCPQVMPKKHRPHLQSKPQSTPPSSLGPANTKFVGHHGTSQSSSTSNASVNDLISRLRIAQTGHIRPENVFSNTSPRSLPPGLRDVLSVPLPPPPRPRAGLRASAHGRLRRTAGPPAPQSWLSATPSRSTVVERTRETYLRHVPEATLDTLPGADFPAKGSLQDTVMRNMARHWGWHVENDGIYISELPSSLKQKLLSYIGAFTMDATRDGYLALRLLFPTREDALEYFEDPQDEYDEVTRLDLVSTIPRWRPRNYLKHAILYQPTRHDQQKLSTKKEDEALESWEDAGSDDTDDSENEESTTSSRPSNLSTEARLGLKHRFPRLAHLSLAWGNFNCSDSPWLSLLSVAADLSTLTSLSLANWPIPSSKVPPTSAAESWHFTKQYHKQILLSLESSTLEAELSEARSVLRRLSNHLYCLKWLDLSGCASWASALYQHSYDQEYLGEDHFRDHPMSMTETGPAWNGAWRNVTYLRIAANWLPTAYTTDGLLELDQDTLSSDGIRERIRQSAANEEFGAAQPTFASSQASSDLRASRWATLSSISAPSTKSSTAEPRTYDVITQDWDTDVEREKVRQRRELLVYRHEIQTLRHVAGQIQYSRGQAKGKYINIDLGTGDQG